MADYKTMRVPEDAWQIAQDARGEGETWGDYLVRCADEPRVEMSEAELRRVIRSELQQNVIEDALR